MDCNEKIKKASIQLILEQPFFATLCMRMAFFEDTNIKTVNTNGKFLSYNPGYIDQLNVDEIKGVIAHEIMHITMLHHTRRNHRDVKKWNEACDYAINPMVLESGFIMPNGYLIDNQYKNISAEQIYSLLQESSPNSESKDNNYGDRESTGDVEDAPAESSKQEIEAEIKQAVVQAAMIAKRQGKLPEFVERIIDEILHPKISWKEVLSRFLAEIQRNEYTWNKPSPRYLYSGIYLPSLENYEPGKIILIVDTSASIDHDILNQFAAEIQDITNTFKLQLTIIYVDKMVRAVQEIEADDNVQLTPKGGGGTDFRPGFKYIADQEVQPKVVVYLTDGACNLLPPEPDYPVLWAQFGIYPFQPPFGETVQVL